MVDNSTSSINCFCKPCILTEAGRLEQKKLYNEVCQIFHDAVQYYSQITRELEEEKKKFLSRLNLNNEAQIQSIQSPNRSVIKKGGSAVCMKCSHQPMNLICNKQFNYRRIPERFRTDGEFSFPVAIFENESDPSQIPMYPKHLVYKDGKDIQLEEIRASMYWDQVKKIDAQISNKMNHEEKNHIESSPHIDINNTPSHKSKVFNGGTPCTPRRKEIRKPLHCKSGENFSTPSLETKTSCKQRNNITLENEKLRSIYQEPRENVTNSILVCNDLKEQISCTKQNHENHRITPAGIRTCAIVPPKIIVSHEPYTNGEIHEKCRVPYITTKTTVTTSPSKMTASEKQTSVNIQQGGRLKLATAKIIARVDPLTNSETIDSNLAAAVSNEQKFTDATFIYNAIEKNSATLQKTFVINGELEPNHPQHSNQKEDRVTEKTSKQLPYLNDISKLLEESNTISNIEPQTMKAPSVNDEDKENILPFNPIPSPGEEDEEDNTCNTKAFALILPSSTPNRRRSQFYSNAPFNEPKNSIDRPRQSVASATTLNLSMIPETSRERSSSSSGAGSVTSAVTSKNFIPDKQSLSAIVETEEKSNTLRSKCDISDPFDPELLNFLLDRVQFPCHRHQNGYWKTNADNMPTMNKSTASVKLGSEKYTLAGEIGKGNYARILKAHLTGKPAELVALKLQKPACVWEYYISTEIRSRLKSRAERQYFLHYSSIFVFRNGSVMLSEWAPFGSLLNFRNALKASSCGSDRFPMAVGVHLSIQITTAIEYLHSCRIIHGDVKPDNFIISNVSYDGKPSVKLIDFGRSIDMTLFPEDTVFHKIITTEDFTCNEMRDGRPWTYQTDLFGMAGTFYVLLNGEYMKTVKSSDGGWMLKKPLARYMFRDHWDPIFETLLNIPSCSSLPDLSLMIQHLNVFYESFSHSEKKLQFTKILPLFKK